MTQPQNDTSSFFTSHQSRDVPRDQWGRYDLPDPVTGEKMKGWTRATTFAATLAEQYGLSIWKQRQVVWGLSRRPDLMTMASTISGPEDKKALGAIVDEAHIAAGTQAKANKGSAIHIACQASENGAHNQVPVELRPHVAGYFKAMREGGLKILPEYVERTVIVKHYHVAGTFDNLVLCPDGKIRVSDKKTGRMDYSDTEFAVQMAVYANADLMFNYDTGRYEPMPDIAKDYAILAHIDPETGHTELQRVNIEWGWVWARTCAEVMDIRKTKHAITPYVPWDHAPNPADYSSAPAESIVLTGFAQNSTTPTVSQLYTSDDFLANRMETPPSYVAAPADHNGTVPGGYVDSTSSVPAEFQAFWSDDRHDDDPPWETDQSVNGVPLEQYGQPAKHPCASGQPCEPTGTDGLHRDGTVCLYGNARPGPVPPTDERPWVQQGEEVRYDDRGNVCVLRDGQWVPGRESDGAEPTDKELIKQDQSLAERAQGNADPNQLMHRILSKGNKAKVQAVARDLMNHLGIKDGEPNAIKLSQYQHKIASAIITLSHSRGVPIPGEDKDGRAFGLPSGPGPDPDAWKNGTASGAGAPAQKASGAGGTEVNEHDAAIRAAVNSIRTAVSVHALQLLHQHYAEKTRVGWTPEMQDAARTRALELEDAAGETPLTPMQMIEGATSKETLQKAWTKATDGGKNREGWTAELDEAAKAKIGQLNQATPVATTGNQ